MGFKRIPNSLREFPVNRMDELLDKMVGKEKLTPNEKMEFILSSAADTKAINNRMEESMEELRQIFAARDQYERSRTPAERMKDAMKRVEAYADLGEERYLKAKKLCPHLIDKANDALQKIDEEYHARLLDLYDLDNWRAFVAKYIGDYAAAWQAVGKYVDSLTR